MYTLYLRFIAPNSKAIAGILAGAALAGLRLLGVEVMPEASEGLRVFLEGVVVGAVVWVAPRNK